MGRATNRTKTGEGVKKRILVVDDMPAIRLALETLLRKCGYHCSAAQSGAEAKQMIAANPYDMVITDLSMERRDTGLEVVRAAIEKDRSTPVLVITGYGGVENAVAAMKAGAYDFMEKPFDIGEIEKKIEVALNRTEPIFLEQEAGSEGLDPFEGIIGKSRAIQQIVATINRFADTDCTVLLTGESGVGKDLFARAIHRASTRNSGNFVPVNCGAIPEGLLESRLFGHRRGAFTGASKDAPGMFEVADGGTIFLDEIGEMPMQLQTKLLRVLEDGRIQPVGEPLARDVDVRVLAATNAGLEEAMRSGKFREDLFYRLNVMRIRIPPLRERPQDILPIAFHFIERFNQRVRRTISGIAPEAREIIMSYPFPGNIRELRNAMERVVILKGDGVIEAQDLPPEILRHTGEQGGNLHSFGQHASALAPKTAPPVAPNTGNGHAVSAFGSSSSFRPPTNPPQAPAPVKAEPQDIEVLNLEDLLILPTEGIDIREFMERIELHLIDQAMARTSGNKAQAARLLKLNRTTLVEKLKKRKTSSQAQA